MNIKNLLRTYPVALAAGSAFVIFASLAVYRNSVLSELRENLAAKNGEATRLSENLHNAQKLDAQLAQMADLVQRIGARLSVPSDVATNQQYFYKLEAESGVKLLDLRPQAAAARPAKKDTFSQYSTIGYTVSVQGDYPHLLTFLRNFESGSRISIVAQAGITPTATSKTNEDLGSSIPLLLNLEVQLLGVL